MHRYKSIYMEYFGYGEQSFIPCEVHLHGCELRAVDIHHVEPRRAGGDKSKDHIDNLLAACRYCHTMIERHQTDIDLKEIVRKRKRNVPNGTN